MQQAVIKLIEKSGCRNQANPEKGDHIGLTTYTILKLATSAVNVGDKRFNA